MSERERAREPGGAQDPEHPSSVLSPSHWAPGVLPALWIAGAVVIVAALLVGWSLERHSREIASLRAVVEKALDGTNVTVGTGTAEEDPWSAEKAPPRIYEISVGDAPSLGPEDAPVTVVEFSDFQCGYCARVVATMYRLREYYGDRVRVVFKHYAFNPRATGAHIAAEAAHRQGAFWGMHDLIFRNQRDLADSRYLAYAGALGLDIEQFQRDRRSRETRQRLVLDGEQALDLGINGSPAFFVNGRLVAGARPFAFFREIIDEELARSESRPQS